MLWLCQSHIPRPSGLMKSHQSLTLIRGHPIVSEFPSVGWPIVIHKCSFFIYHCASARQLTGGMWAYQKPCSVSWDLPIYYLLLDRLVNATGSRNDCTTQPHIPFRTDILGSKEKSEAYSEALLCNSNKMCLI